MKKEGKARGYWGIWIVVLSVAAKDRGKGSGSMQSVGGENRERDFAWRLVGMGQRHGKREECIGCWGNWYGEKN